MDSDFFVRKVSTRDGYAIQIIVRETGHGGADERYFVKCV